MLPVPSEESDVRKFLSTGSYLNRSPDQKHRKLSTLIENINDDHQLPDGNADPRYERISDELANKEAEVADEAERSRSAKDAQARLDEIRKLPIESLNKDEISRRIDAGENPSDVISDVLDREEGKRTRRKVPDKSLAALAAEAFAEESEAEPDEGVGYYVAPAPTEPAGDAETEIREKRQKRKR